MRPLIVFSVLLLSLSQLWAQEIILTPAYGEAYLNGLHRASVVGVDPAEFDTLQAIYAEAIVERDTIKIVHVLGWLANANYMSRDAQKAFAQSNEALQLARIVGLPDSSKALAVSYQTLSHNSQTPDDRIDLLEKGLKAAEPGSILAYNLRVTLTHTLASVCSPKADAVFETLLKEIANLPEELKIRRLYLDYYNKKAVYYRICTGDLEQAEIMQRQVMNYYKALPPELGYNYLNYIDAMARVITLNSEMNRWPAVKELMATIERINLPENVPHAIPYLNIVNQLNAAYLDMGEYEKAERMMLDYFEYTEKHKEQTSQGVYKNAYRLLRGVYFAMGNYDKAWEVHQLALNNLPGWDPSHEIYSITIPSARDLHQEAIDSARSYLRQICTDCPPGKLPKIENKIKTGPNTYYLAGDAYTFLGLNTYFLAQQADLPDVDAMRRAADFVSRGDPFIIRDYESYGTFDEGSYWAGVGLRYQSTILSMILANIAALTGKYDDHAAAFQAIESGKANVLKSTVGAAGLPEALVVKNQRLRRVLDQLEVQVAEASPETKRGLQQDFLRASDEYRTHWLQIRETYDGKLQQAFDERNVELRDLQRSLGDDEVFLNYNFSIEGGQRYLVTQVIRRLGVTSHVQQVEVGITDIVKELRGILQSPLQMQTAKRERLAELSTLCYNLLIAPVKEEIPPGARLAICPSDELDLLPFEVLRPAGKDQPYGEMPFLLREHVISYHYSGTTLVKSRSRKVVSSSVMAFAPVFDESGDLPANKFAFRSVTDSLTQGLRDGRIEPLPATEQEAEEVFSSYPKGNATLLLRKQATKNGLLESLRQPHRIIHLATHGFVNKSNSDLSALACYDDAGGGDLLYASEIRNQPVNADLVILSSCESGIGREVSGEGVLSLNRAFIAGGARNVLSTLWKIDDRYSSELMIEFHKEVAGGKSYAAALRGTKLAMLRQPATALPRYWAPFILIGE